MADRRNSKTRPASNPSRAGAPRPASETGQARLGRRALAASALLAAGALASLALVLSHVTAVRLPGCGDGGPCAGAVSSRWGSVPGVGISTAAVGAGYFVGVLVGWLRSRGEPGRALRAVAVVGAAASLVFIGIMLGAGLPCPYCLVAHAANLAAAAIIVMSPRPAPATSARPHPAWLGLGVGLTVAALAFTVEFGAKRETRRREERALAATVRQLTATPAPAAPIAQPGATPVTNGAPTGIAGRFIVGSPVASVRIVTWTDFQCPDCKVIEEQVARVLETHKDVGVTVRHFPFSTHCNEHITTDHHPDACFGAFAAEAAGDVGGPEAFWKTSRWLFSRDGKFTPQALREHCEAIGIDAKRVLALMESPEIAARVKGDIEAARGLGIEYTPLVFVNGVELRGFTAPEALTRAVEAVSKLHPRPAPVGSDGVPTAREKFLEVFRRSPPTTIPEHLLRRPIGDADAPVTVVVIGDYEESNTADADAMARVFLWGEGPRVRYAFVPYPVDQSCNPHVKVTKFANACAAAKLAEAADMMAGPEAYWRVHEMLMNNRLNLAGATAEMIGPLAGLDAEQLAMAHAHPAAAEALARDCNDAGALGVTSIPLIFINGKRVGTWKNGDENLLPEMFRIAAEQVEKK